jgi:transcriptional regulator
MYVPEHFSEKNINEIKKLIDNYPLATLFTSGINGFTANHLPFLIDFNANGTQTILGHIARNNQLFKENKNGDEVLVVYKGEDAYISPNWYPTKQTTHEVVPTWNYQAVHFYGKLELIEDPIFLLGIVGRLTKTHEKKINEKIPWKINDAPRDFLEKKLSEIIGIKIEVSRFDAKSKVSQNKEKIDFDAVQKKMFERNKNSISSVMKKIK